MCILHRIDGSRNRYSCIWGSIASVVLPLLQCLYLPIFLLCNCNYKCNTNYLNCNIIEPIRYERSYENENIEVRQEKEMLFHFYTLGERIFKIFIWTFIIAVYSNGMLALAYRSEMIKFKPNTGNFMYYNISKDNNTYIEQEYLFFHSITSKFECYKDFSYPCNNKICFENNSTCSYLYSD